MLTALPQPYAQRGIVLLLMLVILIVGASALLLRSLNSAALRMERDKTTADALAQAKEALISYATTVDLSSGSKRPGDLPCPDTNNDGQAELSCGNAAGTTGQSLRIGRLPWKTLGLPDLRDSSGERLWYAVSNNFKYNTRTTCSMAGQPGCLNSDSTGTISVYSPTGTLLNDGSSTGSASTGAVAIVIAPGAPLTRQDGIVQDRSSSGINTATNYLDIATVGSLTEDNASFVDSSATNGFIQGSIMDSNDRLIVNDQLLVISQDNIMQSIQKRVAGEVKQCLTAYTLPANGGVGLYPWTTDPSQYATYSDTSGKLFGRIPDTPFSASAASNASMAQSWPVGCNIASSSGWWLNWKDQVFYGVASGYAPNGTASCGTCITVNPPAAAANKQLVVVIAGKILSTQTRPSTSLGDYLESPNNAGAALFAQSAPSAIFNDAVTFQ